MTLSRALAFGSGVSTPQSEFREIALIKLFALQRQVLFQETISLLASGKAVIGPPVAVAHTPALLSKLPEPPHPPTESVGRT